MDLNKYLTLNDIIHALELTGAGTKPFIHDYLKNASKDQLKALRNSISEKIRSMQNE